MSSTILIAPDAEPIAHVSPYKRFDPSHIGRKRIITKQDLLNSGTNRTPDPAIYRQDFYSESWILKEDV